MDVQLTLSVNSVVVFGDEVAFWDFAVESDNVRGYCHALDPACDFKTMYDDPGAHTNYAEKDTLDAAEWIVEQSKKTTNV